MDFAKETGIEKGIKQGIKQGIQQGIEKGIEQGIKEGEKKEKIKIAKNLLDILDSEIIALKTGLSVEEIEELRDL